MRILIDIGHPAHFHLFKNFAIAAINDGNQILFTTRNKEFEILLLQHSGFNYINLGKHYRTKLGKVFGLLKFPIQIIIRSNHFKPTLYLSHGSIYAAIASWITKKPHISFEDTFNFEQIRIYKPFTKIILTSNYLHPELGRKNIKYNSYHELAYLHSNYFIPDNNIISELGVKPNQKYVVLRFVSWEATHDAGHLGLSLTNKIKAVNTFSKYAKVFISSEKELPPELEPYKFPLPPEKMHQALSFSSLVFGESATMATEGAVLGIPAIYLDNTGRLYTKELEEKYELMYNFSESPSDQEKAILKGVTILSNNKTDDLWQRKREKMLSEKIDITSFLYWFVRDFPNSISIMRESPNFQDQFH